MHLRKKFGLCTPFDKMNIDQNIVLNRCQRKKNVFKYIVFLSLVSIIIFKENMVTDQKTSSLKSLTPKVSNAIGLKLLVKIKV